MFRQYLTAVGFPTLQLAPDGNNAAAVQANSRRKATLLQYSLGPEGFNLYCITANNPEEDGYDEAVARLQAHFGQRPSTVFAKSQFQ